MTNLIVLLVIGAVLLASVTLVAWRRIYVRRHPPLTEYQRQMASITRSLVTLQVSIADNFSPAIRKATAAMDGFAAAWAAKPTREKDTP